MERKTEDEKGTAGEVGEQRNHARCRSWWKDVLLVLVGGGLMALAYPPYDIGNLVWIGLLPLLSALWQDGISRKRAFAMGWLFGMGWYCVSFWWIRQVGYVFCIPQALFMAIAFIPLMALYSCLPGLWAVVAASWLRPVLAPPPVNNSAEISVRKASWAEWAAKDLRSTVRSAIGLGALWVCIEWLRAHGTLGFSWNSLGTALYDGISLVQWAEFVGSTALSFIPVSVSVVLWCAFRRTVMHFRGVEKGCKPWDFYGAVVLLMFLFIGGLLMSQQYAPNKMLRREGVLPLPVMAVQINKDQAEHIVDPHSPEQYQRYLDSTVEYFNEIARDTMRRAREREDVGLILQLPVWVVWPESALPCPFWRREDNRELLRDEITSKYLLEESTALPLARQRVRELGGRDFVLFTGTDECLLGIEGKELRQVGVLNSLAMIPDGFVGIRTASKQHLMPFGEYIPLAQDVKWIGEAYSRITGTQVGEGIRPGTGTTPISAPVPGTEMTVGVIPAVCYEDTVGDHLRLFARSGPQVIVNVSNDAWFRESACGEQQARAAALRCIELRRPMVRAANKGLCCAIAPNGAVIHELRKGDGSPHLPGFSYAVLPVDTRAELTLYARFGDWAVALCALLAIALAAGRITVRARSENRKGATLSEETAAGKHAGD